MILRFSFFYALLIAIVIVLLDAYSAIRFYNGQYLVKGGPVQSVTLPVLRRGKPHQTMTYRFDVDAHPLMRRIIRVVPDECLVGIAVDGQPLDLSDLSPQQRCNWQEGFRFDLGRHLHAGTNHLTFTVHNRSGDHGLDLYHDGSDPLKHWGIRSLVIVLGAGLLLLPLYRQRQLHAMAFVVAALTGYVFWEFYMQLQYELSGVYTADTPIYWAMGQGIRNGLIPYETLFETKPPGIFLYAALALSIEKSFWIGNLLQALALVVTALIPWLGTLVVHGRGRDRWYLQVVALCFGVSLALYAAIRSGEIQVESFGAAWIAVYALLLTLYPRMRYGLWVALAAMALLLGVGMKEPFILPALAASLLLSPSFRGWLKTFLAPLTIAVLTGAVILLLMGSLGAYLEHYLTFMLGDHVVTYGSPIERALQLGRLFDDLKAFHAIWGWMIAGMAAFVAVAELLVLEHGGVEQMVLRLVKVIAAVLLVSLAVGLGGQYYNHHFVFAVPLYAAMFLYLIRIRPHLPERLGNALLATLLLATVTVLMDLPKIGDLHRARQMQRMTQSVRAEAAYVDEVLRRKGVDRYLFIGGNGAQLYAFTEHSPLGPLFFQYDIWLSRPTFRERFLQRLKTADLIVYQQVNLLSLRRQVDGYIAGHFTTRPWEEAAMVPRLFPRYTIYFRNDKAR